MISAACASHFDPRHYYVITSFSFSFFRFLRYSPENRISAEDALKHPWFTTEPRPVKPSEFPTWPARSETVKKTDSNAASHNTPRAPSGGMGYDELMVSCLPTNFHPSNRFSFIRMKMITDFN